MSNIADYLFALALAGLVLWQLVSGKALGRQMRANVSREDNPGMYWLLLLAQSGLLVVILFTGKTSWRLP